MSPTIALVSFRLGVADGVSVAASQWVAALRRLGCEVRTVAGDGSADRLVPGLALDAVEPPSVDELDAALRGVDVVVVENLCSLPMNPRATAALAEVLRGRPAILRHHDLPWERERFNHVDGWPPDDPQWLHVAISEHSRRLLAGRGLRSVTVYHGYTDTLRPGRRTVSRMRLGMGRGTLLLQPTRAIARKNVAAGMALAEALGATYWLTGPAEEGYRGELQVLLSRARCRVLRGLPRGMRIVDAYAAADAVVLPSTWEGFGMPLIESALLGRPLAVSNYPVALEVAELGFRWFPVDDPAPLAQWLGQPDPSVIAANHSLAQRHFGHTALLGRLAELLRGVGVTVAEPYRTADAHPNRAGKDT
jgi:mannosylglucosylglycerate synthase